MNATPTQALADFAAGLQYDDLPPRIRERVKDILLDAVASALAGQQGAETPQVRAVARALGDAGPYLVIGEESLSQIGATLLNAYLITAVTVCDVYRKSLCHISPEVIPPAMIVAQDSAVSGRDFLAALAAGMEVSTRVGVGLHYPSFRARGWHSPGVIGPFGGAAAAGRLLGFDPDRMRNAFGLAGAQAAGTFAAWGTPTVKIHQAHGAMAGLLAASLANQGFSAAPEVLAAPDGGLLNTYSDGGRPDAMLADLGREWELEQISLRPWPVASSLQSVVTSILALTDAHDIAGGEVESVRVALSPTVYQMHATQGWSDRFHAMLSVRYTAAVVLHDRRCWLEQFDPTRLADPVVGAFARERVAIESDSDVPESGARIEVTTRSGVRFMDSRAVPRGDASDPLDRSEIISKMRAAAAGVMPPDTVEEIIAALSRLEDAERMTDIFRLLRVPVPLSS